MTEPEPPMVEPYYADDFATIYHGDCMKLVDAWDIAGAVMVTDPPYGVAYRSGWDNSFRDTTIANDETVDARDAVLGVWGDRPALVFGSWKMPRPARTKAVLTWDKGTVGMGDLSLPWFPCTEELYVLGCGFVGSRTSSVMRVVGRNEYHPTEKPDELMRLLLMKCSPLSIVVDPFMGSGSTLRAAKDLGRKVVGVEIEERYCEIAAKRLAQEVLDFGGVA